MKKVIIISIGFLFISIYLFGQEEVPGIVVGHSQPDTKIYLGSPSLIILSDGKYLASYQEFGPRFNEENRARTFIAESRDRGKNWRQISSIEGLWWANLFSFNGEIYIFGTQQDNGGYGLLVIRKSSDQGKTWSEPVDEENGLLRIDDEYHTVTVPMVVHKGRIFRAVEDRNPPEKQSGEAAYPAKCVTDSHGK